MNRNAIIHPHGGGLFSLVNNVITCLDLYRGGIVHPDWTGSSYGRPEDGNLWNHLFEPTDAPTGDYDVIRGYPDQWLTYKNVHDLYLGPQIWREDLNLLWTQFFRPLPEIMDQAETFIRDNLGPHYISALVRFDGHAGEQVSGQSQGLNQYMGAILDNLLPEEEVFVMCGDCATMEYFNTASGDAVFYPHTRRTPDRTTDCFQFSSISDAQNALIEVLIASRGRALLHPISNMATAALIINPQLQSIYLP